MRQPALPCIAGAPKWSCPPPCSKNAREAWLRPRVYTKGQRFKDWKLEPILTRVVTKPALDQWKCIDAILRTHDAVRRRCLCGQSGRARQVER